MSGKQLQQWQSIFGQDEFVDVTGITNAAWKDENLASNVVGVIVLGLPEEGIKVSLDGGTTFVPMLRALKTGVEYDFQDRFPIATRGLKKIYFRSVASAGPHTITIVKRFEV